MPTHNSFNLMLTLYRDTMAGYRKMAATTDCKLQVEQCCEITVRLLKITFETVSHPHVTVRLDSEFTGSIWMNNA